MACSKTTTNSENSASCPSRCLKPGPGPIYLLPSTVGYEGHDITKGRQPAFSIASRIPSCNRTIGPGPSLYVQKYDRFGSTATPAFSIYPLIKAPNLSQSPGPGAYCPEGVVDRGPAFSLYSRVPPPCLRSSNPAPNSYMLPSCLNGTVKYLGKRLETCPKYVSPGPAKYLPNADCCKWRGPLFSFGQRVTTCDRTVKPGPATYLPLYNTSRSSPQYSFGVKHSECKGIALTDTDKYPECDDIAASGA